MNRPIDPDSNVADLVILEPAEATRYLQPSPLYVGRRLATASSEPQLPLDGGLSLPTLALAGATRLEARECGRRCRDETRIRSEPRERGPVG